MLYLLALLAWLLQFCAPAVSHASERDRTVALRATITVKNNGGIALSPYIHRLTMPASDHAQQRLSRIEYPYGDAYSVGTHDNGVDRFMAFNWNVPAHSQVVREVTFLLRVQSYDYRKAALPRSGNPGANFLAPSRYVESDSSEVARIAREIKRAHASPEQQLLAAYQYPQKHLHYQAMSSKGALHALRTGIGDCTEYAAIFVAISRALGIPARMTSEFLFSKRTAFSKPNHHAAEVYLNGAWVPVDPNLALDASLGYGFGQGAATKVILKRDGGWTWANQIPGVPSRYRKNFVDVTVDWDVRVVD